MADDCSVVVEHLVRIRLGSPGCRKSFDRQQILCGVWNTVQRSSVMPVLNFLFCDLRLLQRKIWCQPCVRIEAWTKLFATVKKAPRQLDRGQFLGLNALCQFAQRQVNEVFTGHERSSWIIW